MGGARTWFKHRPTIGDFFSFRLFFCFFSPVPPRFSRGPRKTKQTANSAPHDSGSETPRRRTFYDVITFIRKWHGGGGVVVILLLLLLLSSAQTSCYCHGVIRCSRAVHASGRLHVGHGRETAAPTVVVGTSNVRKKKKRKTIISRRVFFLFGPRRRPRVFVLGARENGLSKKPRSESIELGVNKRPDRQPSRTYFHNDVVYVFAYVRRRTGQGVNVFFSLSNG